MIDGHVYLQSLGIAHRDIKPENILITNTEPLDFKICDIGVDFINYGVHRLGSIHQEIITKLKLEH